MGRPCHGVLPGLPKSGQGFIPSLAPQGMVGQQFRGSRHRLRKLRLQHLDDTLMRAAAHALQHRLVGGLLEEGVLKRVDGTGGLPALRPDQLKPGVV